MITFEKFSTLPIKVRVLFIKKLLNELGYNLEENFHEDKQYKKALKKYQESNNFSGNCIISHDVFNTITTQVSNHNDIWKSIKSR